MAGNRTSHLTESDAARRPRRFRRRGTVMIFILGILALLGLLGLALIGKTHGEFRRTAIQSNASSILTVRDGVIRRIQEILHEDIWAGPPVAAGASPAVPLSNAVPPGASGFDRFGNPIQVNAAGHRENNEPFDAPGPNDRWLSSTTPYLLIDPATGLSQPQPTGHASPSPLQFEQDVLAYHRVSYLGADVLSLPNDPMPFAWADNSRSPGSYTGYNDASLQDVPLLQTPPPGLETIPLIPGSTTNVTIAAARSIWEQNDKPAFQTAGINARFPYFDTNADGMVDLYDADGDGIPDSPISFVVSTDSADPDHPAQLYAVIRVVDHAAMLNVNVASAFRLPSGGINFDESNSDLQRRGRRPTELLLDEVVHRADWQSNPHTANLAGYRADGATPDPVLYDFDIVRRALLGGLPDFTRSYNLYDLEDELSLRHRGMVVPYGRRFDRQFTNDYRRLDRALPGTLLWSPQVVFNTSTHVFDYDVPANQSARWNRLNADFQPLGTANPTYEGYANGPAAGWRHLLDPDQTFTVRKPMLTTIQTEVLPPPNLIGQAVPSATVVPGPLDSPVDFRLRQLWQLGMNWPVIVSENSHLLTDPLLPADLPGLCNGCSLIDELTVPDDDVPPDWARVQPIDINMSYPSEPADARAELIRYAAAATYLALDGPGVVNYQGMPLTNNAATPNGQLNRLYLAWQFAVNLADYRDSDNVPTILEIPGLPGKYVFGVEKQPFFTEALAYLIAGDSGSGPSGPSGTNNPPLGGPDRWFFAFEVFVPPGWRIDTSNLYLRAPGAGTGLIPLNQFTQVTSGQPATLLDGGPADFSALTDADHGNFFVFTGATDDAPASILNDPDFQARAYRNNALQIAVDGTGSLELVYSLSGAAADPQNHVLDIIDPEYSGGVLADNTTTGLTRFARRPPGATPGQEMAFSLRRSTQGWRFTTCWHVYSQAPSGVGGGVSFVETLGQANDMINELNDNIPESVWPGITPMSAAVANSAGEPQFPRPNGSGGFTLVDGFESGQPFEAFDSVADLSRLFIIGAVNASTGFPQFIEPNIQSSDLPVTALIAETLKRNGFGLPLLRKDRVAAGRIDFQQDTQTQPSSPWAWRLFDYLTTQAHLFDGVDNDGDGTPDLADPTEGYDVLYRLAGRINLNTAPAAILRSGPYMSFLPTSQELQPFQPTLIADPEDSFDNDNAGLYWDFPSAIVAAREDRPASLRLPDNTGILQEVARAEKSPGPGGGGTTISARGALAQVIELAGLRNDKIVDTANPTPKNHLFQVDRFWRTDYYFSVGALGLTYHWLLGTGDPILGPMNTESQVTPDVRYRKENHTSTYVPILSPADSIGDPLEAAGIRGRDVYLSRWTNVYTTRSDLYTVYVALLDDRGTYLHRSQVTLDRGACYGQRPTTTGMPVKVLPEILVRSDGSYVDDTK